jgi:phasin
MRLQHGRRNFMPLEQKKARSEAMQTSTQLPRFEIPNLMSCVLPSPFRALAENSVMQGRETLDTLGAAAEKTYSANARSLNEYGTKIMEAGRSNALAAFDCYRELVAAETQSELLEVWSTHARRQFDAMLTQNREIWSLAWKVAADAPQPIMAGMTQTFARSA